MDIVVRDEERGKGIGKSLMNEAENWAKRRGLEYIELNVLARNTGAHRLYEDLGYRDVMVTMRKEY